MSTTPIDGWARLLGAALVDAEQALSAHDVPEVIRSLSARSSADPEALASAAAEALKSGHATRPGVIAVASGAGVLVLVVRTPDVGLQERQVAHEMSNALTAISGWTRLVRQASDATRDARIAALDSAVADALETARTLLEVNGTARSFDLGDLARRATSGLEPYAQMCGVTLETTVTGPVPVDRPVVSVRSIVQNLLKNAIEASPRGASVEIRVERARRVSRISVLDRGAGLGGPRREGGHGVGLGVVARLATEIRGIVRFRARDGGGTEASLDLRAESRPGTAEPRLRKPTPLPVVAVAAATDDASASSAARRSGERLRRRRILVVEDEPALAEMIDSALSLIDAEVTIARSATELMALDASEGAFDAALVDLRLERGDPGTGLRALAHVVERRLAARVVLTSGAPPEVIPHGVDAVLPKPFDLEGLLAALLPDQSTRWRTRGAV